MGCFTLGEVGKLITDEGNIDGAKYRPTVEENVSVSAKDLRLWQRFAFQQDKTPNTQATI